MFVNNFWAPIQVRLSPNFVSHTLGHRGRGDEILEGERSRSVGEICAILNALLVKAVILGSRMMGLLSQLQPTTSFL